MNDCGLLDGSNGQNTKQVKDCYALQSVEINDKNAAVKGAQAPHMDYEKSDRLHPDDMPLSALVALEEGTCIWMLSYDAESKLHKEKNTHLDINKMELVVLKPGEILASYINDKICKSISPCLLD